MTGEEFTRPVRQLTSEMKKYINLRVNHIGLVLSKRMAEITTSIITVIILSLLAAIILLMLTLAFVAWYGSLTGSYAQGFLVVSGIYLVAGLILLLARKKLITDPIVRKLMKQNAYTLTKDQVSDHPVKNLDDLEKRLELIDLQIQYSELQMQQDLNEMGENLQPSRIFEMLLNQILTSSMIIRILDYFLGKNKKKKKSGKSKDDPEEEKD